MKSLDPDSQSRITRNVNSNVDNKSLLSTRQPLHVYTCCSSLSFEFTLVFQIIFIFKEKHIGELPFEVLNYILKWVVSSDLDFR